MGFAREEWVGEPYANGRACVRINDKAVWQSLEKGHIDHALMFAASKDLLDALELFLGIIDLKGEPNANGYKARILVEDDEVKRIARIARRSIQKARGKSA